ncbi:MAG: DUF4304 domain-containing protein [Phycisphaerales bacterium]
MPSASSNAMSPQDQLKSIVSETIAPRMKQAGYKKAGNRWWKRTPEGRALLSVQSSQYSDRNYIRFTINLGYSSDIVCQLAGEETDKAPTVWTCHTSERVGFLFKPAKDVWWELHAGKSHAAVAKHVAKAMDQCIRFLESTGSDEYLLKQISKPSGLMSWATQASLLLVYRGRGAFGKYIDAMFKPENHLYHEGWLKEVAALDRRAKKLGY